MSTLHDDVYTLMMLSPEVLLVCFWSESPQWARASSFTITRFLDHTWRTAVNRTPLDEWSVRRRDLYLTTHKTLTTDNVHAPVGFEPTISAGERSQTYALDRVATGTGMSSSYTLEVFQTKVVQKIKTRILCSISFFSPQNRAVYEVMWKNIVEPDWPQMKIQNGACTLRVG
jgi:hypothetical protein